MLNSVHLMGRLTRDPELRQTQNGVTVTSFTIAVDRDYVQKGEEKQTDFIDIVAWRNTAEFVSKYFVKGQMIVVSGRLQIRDWTDKDGNKRRNAEVLADHCYFGEAKRNEARERQNGEGGFYQPTTPVNITPPGFSEYGEDSEEDFPF